ncbi:MAG TPA: VCBS repeat-containing protein, partial [Planctomycetota bacterium]|nr:VCBS repeat-containing protein [Planctomycetota bacterium]
MDLNGDGNDDLISGSYWPGTIYVFWGKGGGKYSPVEPLKNAAGEKLHGGPPWKSKDAYERDSLAS